LSPASLYILNIGLMHGWQVIAVEAVLYQQLPIGADAVSRTAGNNPPASQDLGGIECKVDPAASLSQVVGEVLDVRIKADEMQTAIAVDPRRSLEAERTTVEAVGVGRLVRYPDQLAISVEGPAMVEALKRLTVPSILPADQRSAMGAGVKENANVAITSANEEDGTAGDGAPAVVARLLDLRLVANVQPAAIEDTLALEVEHIR